MKKLLRLFGFIHKSEIKEVIQSSLDEIERLKKLTDSTSRSYAIASLKGLLNKWKLKDK